ncbi:POLR3K [Jimgerdemannia flammicorona]|uniref:DNA-directed RNA polymerase subunit n=1 Tax=Jimgerdemannia flammicorona TaxID=994334 RepID=A0A433BEM3_9FUNG|nr:POLR3K [Jimgerdemannia flammicorona]
MMDSHTHKYYPITCQQYPARLSSIHTPMFFCPVCANVLLVQKNSGLQFFLCQTCPYVFHFEGGFIIRTKLKRKEVDDVLGGAAAWENVDFTEGKLAYTRDFVTLSVSFSLFMTFSLPLATCPKCEHRRAFYMQIQIRSADEPMSTFYKCCNAKCGYQWKEM